MTASTKGILYADGIEVSVSNTSSFTQVFSYNLPANALSNANLLRIGVRGLCFNGTGSAKAVEAKLEIFDGSTTADVATFAMTVYDGTGPFTIDTELLSISTALQKASICFRESSYDTSSLDENVAINFSPLSSSVDLTKPLTLKIYVKPSVAHSGFNVRKDWAFIELV